MSDWTVDANVLVYALDRKADEKRPIAEAALVALRASGAPMARQAIGEFVYATVRKGKLTRDVATHAAREFMANFETFGASHDAFELALDEAATGQTQFWDAVLLAACAEAGIDLLLTEDMAQGRHRLGVEIVNPFAPSPAGRKALKKRGISAR